MTAVTVVIPSFRGGALLREAVASVQAQSLTDWELIIVLDGCEDDLSDIESTDQRVRVIRQRNRGASIARNVGVSHARSTFIALLDDDDLMSPERLRLQTEAMTDESIGVSHTQYCFIDEHGAVIGEGDAREYQYIDFLRGDGGMCPGSAMFRRDLFHAVGGFNSLLTLGEDLDLIYRLARESTVRFVPETLYQYRRHGSNVWLGTNLGSEECRMIFEQHLVAAKARGETASVKAIRRGMSLIPSDRVAKAVGRANAARKRRDYAAMLVAFATAFLMSPAFTLRAARRMISNVSR
ncbi:MAG: glycosyltransferase family A protein [Acidimicrobiales bacterium]